MSSSIEVEPVGAILLHELQPLGVLCRVLLEARAPRVVNQLSTSRLDEAVSGIDGLDIARPLLELHTQQGVLRERHRWGGRRGVRERGGRRGSRSGRRSRLCGWSLGCGRGVRRWWLRRDGDDGRRARLGAILVAEALPLPVLPWIQLESHVPLPAHLRASRAVGEPIAREDGLRLVR